MKQILLLTAIYSLVIHQSNKNSKKSSPGKPESTVTRVQPAPRPEANVHTKYAIGDTGFALRDVRYYRMRQE